MRFTVDLTPPFSPPALGWLILACGLLALAVRYRNRAIGSRALLPAGSSTREGKPIYPAGPPADAPFFGNQLSLNANGHRYLDLFMDWHVKYGIGYEMTIPGYRFIDMNHPTWLEHVQKTRHGLYGKGYVRLAQYEIQRNGIFTVDGLPWMMQRKSASNAFSRKHFLGPITTKLNQHVDILVGLLDNLAVTGEWFDFQDVMLRFTMLFSCATAFSSHSTLTGLLTSDPACLTTRSEFVDAFDSASPAFDHRNRNVFWPWTEKFDRKAQQTIKKCIRGVYDFVEPIVAARLAKPTSCDIREDGDLLDLFLTQTRDPWELSGWILNILFAGRDTTAFTVAYQMYEMHAPQNSKYHCVERVLRELEASRLTEGDRMHYDQMKDLPFLMALWNETTRFHPASPRGVMQCYKDDVLPEIPEMGIPAKPVKKGDLMMWQDWVMNRMTWLWGEDADSFNPDRWLDTEGNLILPSLWKWHSFNAGPRTCLGKQLATFDALTCFSAIIPRYEITLRDPNVRPGYTTGFNMGMADGCWISVKRRAGH